MLGRESAIEVTSAEDSGGRIALAESEDSNAVDMIYLLFKTLGSCSWFDISRVCFHGNVFVGCQGNGHMTKLTQRDKILITQKLHAFLSTQDTKNSLSESALQIQLKCFASV
jgi:hypothetical protein